MYVAENVWAVHNKFSMSICIFLDIFMYVYGQIYTLYKYKCIEIFIFFQKRSNSI